MGYNSSRYIHTLYQAMNLAYSDRDFYYGDPYYPPVEPMQGLLSKEYAKNRSKLINWERNDPDVMPSDPYPFQGEKNPFLHILENWNKKPEESPSNSSADFERSWKEGFLAGTTTDREVGRSLLVLTNGEYSRWP